MHVQKDRFQESGFRTNVYAGQTTSVDFALAPLPKITGLVLNPSGKPVPKAHVTGFIYDASPDLETESKTDGSFDLPWHSVLDKMLRPCSGVIVRDPKGGLAAFSPFVAGNRRRVVGNLLQV